MSAETPGNLFCQCIGLQFHVSPDTAAGWYYHDIQRNRTLEVPGNCSNGASAGNGEGIAVLQHVPQAGSTDSSKPEETSETKPAESSAPSESSSESSETSESKAA